VDLCVKRFSLYHHDEHSAKFEPPCCRQSNSGQFLTPRAVSWDEIIDENNDDVSWADLRAQRSGSSCPSDGNDIKNCEDTNKTQGCEIGTGRWKGTVDVTGRGIGTAMEKVKGKGKRNWKGKGIIKQTPEGNDSSCTVTWLLQKEPYNADSEREG
jgi:hypothetical protein